MLREFPPFPRPAPGRALSPTLHWSMLGVLIIAEGAVISACFDAEPLADAMPQWWARALAQAGMLVPLGIALGTATVLFVSTRWREVPHAGEVTGSRSSRVLLLAGHLAAFALFFRVTAIVFDGALQTSSAPGLWALAWVLTGTATLGLWMAALAPAAVVRTVARRLGPMLPASIIVGIAAWSAGDITASWWEPLRYSTLWAVQRLLAPVTPDLIFEPSEYVIGTQSFLVKIAPKCAGYEGMGLMAVFVGAYLWLFRQRLRFPHALLLLPIGIGLAWWANVARLAALVSIGTRGWEALAMGGFHAYSGSILFCTLALGLAFVSLHVPFFSRDEETAVRFRDDPTAAHLTPLLVLVAARMIIGVVTTNDVHMYLPLQAVVVLALVWWFRRAYRDPLWSWSWSAVAIGAAACALWIPLARTATAAAAPPWPSDLSAGWIVAWLPFRLLSSVVAVPLAEELAFRGYVMRRLIASDFERSSPQTFTWLSFLGSSLLFGIMHQHVVAATIAGMCYALAVYRRGRLGDAVLAHAATNALLAAYALASGHWAVWG